ncbi:MAG: hypothetical protein ACAI34_16480 [Verrucomicrobium sp.]
MFFLASSLPFVSRTLYASWLASLCWGMAAPAQPPPVQVFTSPRLEAQTSWLGNSYGGGTQWVQQDVHAMTVMPDGTVFTNVPWDEAGGNAGEYRDGKLIRYGKHTHGWGHNGGEAVAANSRYVYVGVRVDNENGGLKDPGTWPPKGSRWQGISRRLRSDLSKGAPFADGKGGKGDTLKGSFLVVAEVPDKAMQSLPGIAASESRLYVADPHSSQIKVYDAETLRPTTSWMIRRAGPLTLDATGTLWMLERAEGNSPAMLVRFDAKGEEQVPLLLPGDIQPVAFCLTADHRVLVADEGPSQQIVIYTLKEDQALVETGRFGEPGGIVSGVPGAFADRKLNGVRALGTDVNGNLYLAHAAQSGGGSTVLESYRLAEGTLNWRLLGLTFVDMADIDAGSEVDAFTKEEHFRLDYSRPPGSEWSYAGYTLNRLKYPQDSRLHLWSGGVWVRHLGGQRILFVNDMNAQWLQVFRFSPKTDGETAIPSGLFARQFIKNTHAPASKNWPPHQPAKGAWIWRDSNGNGAFNQDEYSASNDSKDVPAAQGWWVDREGGVWLATETLGIRYFPFQGLDARGNPSWDFAKMQTFPHPMEFRAVKRLRYLAETDTLYLGGTTADDANQHWKPMGPVLARYDGWLKGEKAKVKAWQTVLPYVKGSSGHESCEPMGFDVAGEYIFAPYTGAAKTQGTRTGRVEVFRTQDGSSVGHLEPDKVTVGEVGLQDLRETLTAHRRANGEYLVLIEDDYRSKVVMYRWKGEAAKP